jgi:hypothetical protein
LAQPLLVAQHAAGDIAAEDAQVGRHLGAKS